MELLDLLEKRVNTLVTELTQLRQENGVLREQLSASQVLCAQHQGELTSVKDALTQEGQLKDAVLERIEFLLQRLQELDKPV